MADPVTQYLRRRNLLPSPIEPLVQLPLTIASWVYRPAIFWRNSFFNMGLRTVKKLKTKVISVGNITIGGSGKTPVVQMLAKHLKESGQTVVILSRGYRPFKPSISSPKLVDPTIADACDIFGDEPVMLAKTTGVPVVVCRDRYKAGIFAEGFLRPTLFLLDDGFQHRTLYREADLVVVDVSQNIDRLLFPRGSLREPWPTLTRAAIIFLSKINLSPPHRVEEWRGLIKKYATSSSLIDVEYNFSNPSSLPLGSLKGERLFLVSGIGDPESFSKMTQEVGGAIVGHRYFPDHHIFSQADISASEEAAKAVRAKYIVTTEKDGVKLQKLGLNMAWVELPLNVIPAQAELKEVLALYGIGQ
ncbi:MAG TPA: tetraacyldisaccharide 4'-kinase [Bdellovibrionota bacterium]|nr:tetraacyldisaccharide 4'-kinase [Bdellovibrionota bacterium]